MDIYAWIENELKPTIHDSTTFMYNDMDSQSNYCLPLIYRPFDVHMREHWRDRGACFDFVYATRGEGKRVLDFGPGDGWPSLIVAPFMQEVIGVDGSKQRVQICSENAKRMGVGNAKFLHVAPGSTLPFDDCMFDGAMAASSIEQTPDPKSTLQELWRLLKPNGRLRIYYEGLEGYRGAKEQEMYLDRGNEQSCVLTLYNRNIQEEKAYMYKIFLSKDYTTVKKHLVHEDNPPTIHHLTTEKLKILLPSIGEVRKCILTHPSGKTLVQWLHGIGFSEVRTTHSGAWFAGELFDSLSVSERPGTMAAVDELLRPLVCIIVTMRAPVGIPGSRDPMITAIK